MNSEETCPDCGGRLSERAAAPAPVALQIAFGVSFLLFLFAPDLLGLADLTLTPPITWGWTVLQIGLGFALLRARRRAAGRIVVCPACATRAPE